MLKRLIFYVTIFLFVFPIYVNASELTCEYKLESGRNFKVCVNYKLGLPVTYDSCGTKVKFDSAISFNLSNNDFLNDSGNLICPTVRVGFKTDKNEYTVVTFTKDLTVEIPSYYYPKNIEGIINEEKSVIDNKESNNSISDKYACIYDEGKESEYSLTLNGDEIVANLTGAQYKNYCGYNLSDKITVEDFKNKSCPDVYNIKQARQTEANHKIATGSCRGVLVINKNVGITKNSESKEADSIVNVNTGEKEKYTKKGDDVAADCNALLTPEVQELVRNILNLIKYAGPILVVVLTIFDLIKAALSGDAGELKKVSGRFIKRVIAAVLLFFIPIIIGLIFDFFNITSSSCILR